MKGEVLFEKMTGISDGFIAEAALVAPAGAAAPKKKPFASLSRALSSGWGVACICLIVAIAAVVGMVAWGRMGSMTDPGSDPTVRFAFSYEMTANDGSAWSGTALPGDVVNVSTTVVNHGKSFDTYDFFAYARFVLQEDESVVIEGHYPVVDTDKHTVEEGSTGSRTFHFHIPANATPGVYDLVLSYGEEQQVYKGVLTVGETESETSPPAEDGRAFSFGYKLAGNALTGASYLMDTWITNEGEPFTYEGSSMGFAPAAVLIHMETLYRIEGSFGMDEDHGVFTVNTGDMGHVTQEFFIPADAPTGAYALRLSYGGVQATFDNVLTVAVPTVIDPAVLYNLTMPMGSDWLYEPIDEAYVDGELVTVRVKFATVVSPLFFFNGELITPIAGDDQLGYWEYNFIMPQKDSEIIFHTYDGTAPYAEMLKAFILSNPYLFTGEEQFYYYGEFGDGVTVALQLGYGEAIWSTAVGGYTFVTPNTHDMVAYCNGTLYELQVAYDMGLLTDGDLEVMLTAHKEWFPDD